MEQAANLSLTEAAARRINKIVADEKNPALMVRLEVAGGGCSGYSYKFGFDSQFDAAEDIVVTRDGAKLVVDKTSLGLLQGSEVDYGEDLMEAGFRIKNPSAEIIVRLRQFVFGESADLSAYFLADFFSAGK